MYAVDDNRRSDSSRTRPHAERILGALFVVLCLTLHAPPAFAPSGRFPSLDLLVLTSDRVALVRVVSPRDTSHLSLCSRSVVHYQVVTRLLGGGPSSDSVTVQVGTRESVPVEGDTLIVLFELRNRSDFKDGTRYGTVVNLTDFERSGGWPAVTSDCRVPHDRDSLLAVVVLRAAMVRAGYPLGDDRRFSLASFVEGQGCVERWMLDGCEAIDVTNPMSANVLASPADGKMLPACRRGMVRHLARMRAEDMPALSRALVLASQAIEARTRP
jgi:hypothetical protein